MFLGYVCGSYGALSLSSHVSTSCFLGPAAWRRTRRSLHTSPGASFSRIHCNTSRCPFIAAYSHMSQSHGQSCSRAHCNTARCPPAAARAGVAQSHGQCCSRAHCSTRRCPDRAAYSHVSSFHGQPWLCSHFTTSRCPRPAAAHVVQAFHGQPVLCSHSNTSWFPPPAACEQASFKHSGGRRYPRCTGAVLFARLAHCMSAVAATAAAHPRPTCACRARRGSWAPAAAAPPAERGRGVCSRAGGRAALTGEGRLGALRGRRRYNPSRSESCNSRETDARAEWGGVASDNPNYRVSLRRQLLATQARTRASQVAPGPAAPHGTEKRFQPKNRRNSSVKPYTK